jgi:hypothetical protein
MKYGTERAQSSKIVLVGVNNVECGSLTQGKCNKRKEFSIHKEPLWLKCRNVLADARKLVLWRPATRSASKCREVGYTGSLACVKCKDALAGAKSLRVRKAPPQGMPVRHGTAEHQLDRSSRRSGQTRKLCFWSEDSVDLEPRQRLRTASVPSPRSPLLYEMRYVNSCPKSPGCYVARWPLLSTIDLA